MALAGIIVGMIFRDFPGFNIYLGTLLGDPDRCWRWARSTGR